MAFGKNFIVGVDLVDLSFLIAAELLTCKQTVQHKCCSIERVSRESKEIMKPWIKRKWKFVHDLSDVNQNIAQRRQRRDVIAGHLRNVADLLAAEGVLRICYVLFPFSGLSSPPIMGLRYSENFDSSLGV